jgi:hypothetical protein
MGRIIPNEETWVGFALSVADANLNPTEAECAGATDLTPFLMSINASAQGNQVPTPSFDSLFETSIIGTSQATFSADFYRDDVADTAWELLPRATKGYMIISRFGGSGADQIPVNGDACEVWPIEVVSRTAAALANNTVQTFTVTCAVNIKPNESALVSGGVAAVPSVIRNLSGTAGASGVLVLDWDAPAYGAPITSYDVYTGATLNGAYTKVVANITKVGTTATLSSLTPGGQAFYKVSATNATGEGPQSSPGVQYTAGA